MNRLVQFSTEEEAQTAIREMNQQSLDGRLIFVRKVIFDIEFFASLFSTAIEYE